MRWAGVVLVFTGVAGCAGKRMTGRGLVELDDAWAARAAASDVDGVMEYWTDDATMYLPDSPPLQGKGAIRGYFESGGGKARSWAPCCAGIDDGGSMGYTLGQGSVSAAAGSGAPGERNGRYVAIWRNDDGRWRCAVKCWTPAP